MAPLLAMVNAIFFNTPIESNHIGAQYREIFGYIGENGQVQKGIYAPFLEDKKDLTILDIGGNIGLTSYYFSRFAKQIYTLEPAKEHFECLNAMVKGGKFILEDGTEIIIPPIPNVKPINKALWIEDTKKTLIHGLNKTMHTLHFGMQATGMVDQNNPPEEVECIKLDTLFEQEGITHVDLMKLDVEGTEVEILSSDSFANVANKIDLIIGEIHSWSLRHPNQIKDALKNNGFSYDIIPNNAELFVAKRI